MNAGQILEQVSLLIHHDLTNEQLVTKMNQLSRQLFRKLPLPDKIYKFKTVEMPYYDIPSDCAEDRIRCVIIDDLRYERLEPEETRVNGRFCSVIVGKLFIYPNPVGKDAYLYYGQRHVEISATNLGVTPS